MFEEDDPMALSMNTKSRSPQLTKPMCVKTNHSERKAGHSMFGPQKKMEKNPRSCSSGKEKCEIKLMTKQYTTVDRIVVNKIATCSFCTAIKKSGRIMYTTDNTAVKNINEEKEVGIFSSSSGSPSCTTDLVNIRFQII